MITSKQKRFTQRTKRFSIAALLSVVLAACSSDPETPDADVVAALPTAPSTASLMELLDHELTLSESSSSPQRTAAASKLKEALNAAATDRTSAVVQGLLGRARNLTPNNPLVFLSYSWYSAQRQDCGQAKQYLNHARMLDAKRGKEWGSVPKELKRLCPSQIN